MQTSVLRCSRSITAPLLSSSPCWCWPKPKICSPGCERKWVSILERLLPSSGRYQRAGGLLKMGSGSSKRTEPDWAFKKCRVPSGQISARSLPLVKIPLPSWTTAATSGAAGLSSNAPGIAGKSDRLVARTRAPSGPHGSTLRISPFKRQNRILFSVETWVFMGLFLLSLNRQYLFSAHIKRQALQRGTRGDGLTARENLVCPGILPSGPCRQIHLALARPCRAPAQPAAPHRT